MHVQKFDIVSLLEFTPPKYLCEKCYALLADLSIDRKTKQARCPVCNVKYLLTGSDEYWSVPGRLRFDDLIGHSRKLAIIASQAQHSLTSKKYPGYPPMRALFEALLNAEKFVHFTTYGISHMLLGAIKMTAQRVDVRGIISGVKDSMLEELTEYEDEAPKLDVKIFGHGGQPKNWDTIPHQKIIVIDGLVAFKGSANLTISGWRKAALGRDVIEVVTDVKEVFDIHNRFFSPIWAEFSDVQEIEVQTLPF